MEAFEAVMKSLYAFQRVAIIHLFLTQIRYLSVSVDTDYLPF